MRGRTSIGFGPALLAAVCSFPTSVGLGGEIDGRVTVTGPRPARPAEDRTLEPACGKGAAQDDPLLISRSGGVQNAVVRILGVDQVSPVNATSQPLPPVIVGQKGCSYVPRVQAAQRGQPLVVENKDPLLHNLHAFERRKGLFNVAQPPRAPPVRRELSGIEMLRLKCDIHPWMLGWIVFNDNPYFGVTDAEGRFSIRGVPPGNYALSVWHELLGLRQVEVKVPDGSVEVKVNLTR